MARLPSAVVYENFAYHVELLKQFAEVGWSAPAHGEQRRASAAEAPSSVHGSSVFTSFRKDKSRKAALAFRRANSSAADGWNNLDGTTKSCWDLDIYVYMLCVCMCFSRNMQLFV